MNVREEIAQAMNASIAGGVEWEQLPGLFRRTMFDYADATLTRLDALGLAIVPRLPTEDMSQEIDEMIDLVIAAYHTTRLADVPAALHIRSRLGERLVAAIASAAGLRP